MPALWLGGEGVVDLTRDEVLGWQAVKKGLATVGLLVEMPKMVANRESVFVDSSGRCSTLAGGHWLSSSIPISITLSHTELLAGLRLSLGMFTDSPALSSGRCKILAAGNVNIELSSAPVSTFRFTFGNTGSG